MLTCFQIVYMLALWYLSYIIELIFLLNSFGSMTSYLCHRAHFFCSITLSPWHLAYIMELNSYSITLAPWYLAYVMELTFLLNYLGSMTSSLCEGAQLLWLHDILLMSQSSFSCLITLVHDILLMSWSSILTQLIWLHDILLMSRSSLFYLITLAPWHLTYVIELTFFLNHFGSMTFCLCQEALFLFAQLF